MFSLAFDTTAQACSVALFENDKLLGKNVQRMEFGQAEALMPAIRGVLQEQKMEMQNLDLITVCCGPGSFTGVRSALAAARTFELALPQVKVTGVTAFDAYIEDLEPQELAEVNAVIIETKRSDFYLQIFDAAKKSLEAPQALVYDEVVARLRNRKVSLIGDGVERFLSRPSGLSLHVIRMEDLPPIEALARCGNRRYQKNNMDYPKPLYLRAPDVCVKS